MSYGKFRSRPRSVGRKENTREVKPRFLIVCEDSESAPNYFRGFRLTSAEIIVIGTGSNCISLVEHAIELREKKGLSNAKDQTWVVMDRNSFPQDNYDNSFQKAAANGIRMAHSNECLEHWFLLHFHYTAAPLSRGALPGLLGGCIGT
jgi:hypothetical protein